MKPEEKDLIRRNEPELVKDIIPSSLLSWLLCLTNEDKEVITAEERNYGPIKASITLLDRLKRRDEAFQQLVVALRKNMLGHLALLLDPDNKVED
ncbi:uncharacterized protein LOC114541695 [Dendronephthya gigantea]|uniref:uncharacterized protein LOC114541695 n=1 Tax=Dendronephthya gigantea TaxID=151771 RepID=UPI00106CA268|nr:uncharacterized protein LOC114541695 [Dendronephthya gigantea]